MKRLAVLQAQCVCFIALLPLTVMSCASLPASCITDDFAVQPSFSVSSHTSLDNTEQAIKPQTEDMKTHAEGVNVVPV